MSEYRKQYKKINKERYDVINKTYQEKNKDKISSQHKEYYIKNKQKIHNYILEYSKNKYKTDINFKIKSNLRTRLFKAIKNNFKSGKTLELLGCSVESLKIYLEQQFKPEMSWDNHGKIWELDHIKSCSNFDLTKREEQCKCFHYTNLQPLFKTTNIAESFGYNDEIGNRNKYNI